MKKKRFVSVAAVLLLFSLATGSAFATPFTPILDEFWIVKDTTEIFRDSFIDNVPPPSGPDGTSTYGVFGAGGITGETGGKLTMTPSLGNPGINRLGTSALRILTTNSANPNFLGFDSSFEIHGLYDMSNIPMVKGQFFGIRAHDRAMGLGNEGNNSFEVGVIRSSITNEVGVVLSMVDVSARTRSNIWWSSIASLLPGADQIELILSKDAASNMLNASYFVYDMNANNLGSDSKNNVGAIYNGEDYIRAQFLSTTSVPEPTTMFLLGTGLVGLAGAARRRKKKNQA